MKRIFCALISVLMILSSFTFSAFAAEKSGATFAVDELYRTSERLESQPHTYEAWIKVEKDAPASELGVIAGNYKNGSTHSYGFEVRANGNPFLWLGYGGDATNQRISFDKVDLRTGEWTHVAVTNDANTAYCYINGELVQTVSGTLTDVDMSKTGSLCIGGDLRSGNKRWLKNSELASVALYSDIRTADEIKAGMAAASVSDPDIIAAYDFSAGDTSILKDVSPKGRDLTYSGSKLSVPKVEDTEKGGMSFTDEAYKLAKKIEVPINTFDATVYFPKNYTPSERGGVIIGNYNGKIACVNFEIYSDGSPRVYIKDSANNTYNFVFDNANVYTGEWTRVTVVRESSSKMSCYINGELAQTLNEYSPDVVTTDVHVLGGDQRSGNEQYFKGRIKSVALYADALTPAHIAASSTDKSICRFELEGMSGERNIEDKSGNGFGAKRVILYFTDKAPVEDYAYSFAVIGDTQILALKYPEKFTALYDWVLGNVDPKKIKFVLGLGDITDDSTPTEWELAKKNIHRMDGVVHYSLVRGNHDTTSSMNKYFPLKDYKDVLGGTYGNDIFNSWQEFSVGEIKYLVFALDYGAPDEILAWADKIIAEHPEHNVIITTHAYLFRDGTTLDAGDVVPPSNKGAKYNNGDHMWDKLIKKHENIVLVLSGHDPSDYVVYAQDKGENGNVVTQMLVDPQGVDKAQGGVGLVTMLYFSADGKTMQVETYSTDRKAFYLEENQFTLTLDLAEGKMEETTAEETTVEAISAPETQQGATEAPATAPATEPVPEKSGCGASVSLAIVPMILLAAAVSVKRRREE